jgi:hypothetical protein
VERGGGALVASVNIRLALQEQLQAACVPSRWAPVHVSVPI